ncbi:MAG: VanZ family protein [Cyclobacteriaceae bacterium]
MPELEQDFLISTDKLAHFGVFLVLSFLTARGLRKQQKHQGLKPKYAFYTLLITVTYGLLLESLQLLSDGRSVEWYDALANTLGCLGGLLFFIVLKKA